MREHSSNLFFGQDNVFHRVLPTLEVLRVVVDVGWEEELFSQALETPLLGSDHACGKGITLIPVEALPSLDAAYQPRCAAVSEVYNGVLGFAQRAACGTQAWVSIPEFRV